MKLRQQSLQQGLFGYTMDHEQAAYFRQLAKRLENLPPAKSLWQYWHKPTSHAITRPVKHRHQSD